MKDENDYVRDLTEIRSIMERSTKFLSLSGWAGIMAGIYALGGAYIARKVLFFNLDSSHERPIINLGEIIVLALIVLILAGSTAIYLSHQRAEKKGEKIWNHITRQLLINILVPLIVGGLLIIILFYHGLAEWAAPMSLLFYGLALFNGSKFTLSEVRILGIVQIILGLICSFFLEYGILIWSIGFGLAHIIYGIYMHYKYER